MTAHGAPPPSPDGPRARGRVGWGIALGCVVLSILALEGYVRAFHVLDYPPVLYAISETRGWGLRPHVQVRTREDHVLRVNARGLRDRDFRVPKDSGTYRLVMLGDSYVFGAGVADRETLPKHLERALADPTVEVVNAGVPGYGMRQEAALLREVGFAYEPDAVLLGFYHNDLKPYRPRPFSRARRWFWAVRPYAYAYDYLRALRHRARDLLTPPVPIDALTLPADWWATAREEMDGVFALCENRNVAVAVIYVGLQRPPGVSARVAGWCAAAQVPYYDLRAAYGARDVATLQIGPRDGHPTAAANAEAARALAAFLRATPSLGVPPARGAPDRV